MDCNYSVSSCGKQAAEAGGNGTFLGLLSAWDWHCDLVEAVDREPKSKKFP